MPLKTTLIMAIILELVGNTSITDLNSQQIVIVG